MLRMMEFLSEPFVNTTFITVFSVFSMADNTVYNIIICILRAYLGAFSTGHTEFHSLFFKKLHNKKCPARESMLTKAYICITDSL